MRSYRYQPYGKHDTAVMADPTSRMEAFQRFVASERSLLPFPQEKLEAEKAMLG